MKIHEYDSGHMAKMAVLQIYCKYTFKNLLSKNHLANFDETWYEALETQALYLLFKLRPWVDLDLFYGKVKFCN